MEDSLERPESVSFLEALIYWLKLGFISFGGPAGQISMMHQELVEKRRWISEHRFLPSLFILIGLTWAYLAFGDVPAVEGILYGIKPAVTAIVIFAAYRIGSRALKNNVLRGMAVLAFIAIFALDIPFPYIVLMAGIIGYIGSHYAPDKFKAGGGHGSSKESYGAAIIDDDTPAPEHTKFKWSRFIVFLLVGLSIGGAVMAALMLTYGWQDTLTQMSWFFTKAALVTFGGAYAVLPYVYQGGVEQYAWLSGTQMIDGLALGETTPGPLIMVVAFVGFVGGWTKELFGPDALLMAGVAGASIATLYTFLPSFLFILLGGPAVEATRGDMKFTAPLTGITAAVVGVILNLATFFAYHVLWPQGFDNNFEWLSAVIGAAAFIALFKYKVGIVQVIGACAAIGLGYSFLL